MKKVALVFLAAVFIPSLVLAWLAVRSLRDQQFVLERQQYLLCQEFTDSIARQIENLLGDRQHEFSVQIEQLLARHPASEIAGSFDEKLRAVWPLADVGFVVTKGGDLVAPRNQDRPAAKAFLRDNGKFLNNLESAEVYWNSLVPKVAEEKKSLYTDSKLNDNSVAVLNRSAEEPERADTDATANSTAAARKNYKLQSPPVRSVFPQQQLAQIPPTAPSAKMETAAVQATAGGGNYSKIAPAEAEFQELVGDASEGTVARFVDNKLTVFFWRRSPSDPRYIFGAQLALPLLVAEMSRPIQDNPSPLREDVCVALLNDSAKPETLSRAGFKTNWKHPFVSSEIGESLPHWEVAAYLLNPAKLTESARALKLTLGLLIAVLVLAIGVGGWLIVNDLNRQLALARQKTDFVSNVSHELKTPLTSIRMFSELLAENRVSDPAKQRSYLNIITAETARLTRLINNVLDFSRLERGEKKYHFEEIDLVRLAAETVDSYRPHLENHGFKLDCSLPPFELRVRGDGDALAQVVVNLLSNAEKYSHDRKEIIVQAGRRNGPLPCAEIKVLDRGLGVPRGSEEKIFEKFYRAHDSLGSGTQGSGLGLTLARQIARTHGGDVFFERRDGGGSCFCLRLPILSPAEKTASATRI